jgi:hypothetical protein
MASLGNVTFKAFLEPFSGAKILLVTMYRAMAQVVAGHPPLLGFYIWATTVGHVALWLGFRFVPMRRTVSLINILRVTLRMG